jgi:hypothetical protein
MTSAPASAREIKVSLPALCFAAVGRPAMEGGMTSSVPLADAKISSIDLANATRHHPFCRRLYATLRQIDFRYCVLPIPCLFNQPRHAIAPSGPEHRGAIMGTVSLSEAASRDGRMLRRTNGPAITSNPKGNLSEEVQPFPNRCNDLSHHRWTECLRMLSDHERSEKRRRQARSPCIGSIACHLRLLDAWKEAERAAPKTTALPSPPPVPNRPAPHHRSCLRRGPLSLQEKRPTTMAAAEEDLDGHPMPWRPAEKPAKSTPAPATTLPEPAPAPLQYQEESDGHPMPWRPASTPNGTRGAS